MKILLFYYIWIWTKNINDLTYIFPEAPRREVWPRGCQLRSWMRCWDWRNCPLHLLPHLNWTLLIQRPGQDQASSVPGFYALLMMMMMMIVEQREIQSQELMWAQKSERIKISLVDITWNVDIYLHIECCWEVWLINWPLNLGEEQFIRFSVS